MKEMHLFAGIGGGILGGILLGHDPVCAVEIDEYCLKVLKQRTLDGVFPNDLHLHGDIRTLDGSAWKGSVDVVCGGFPCQDLSIAWSGDGIHGKRSGLFFELIRVVCEVEPEWVFLENVPALTGRGLDTVLGGLAQIGFDAAWTMLSGSACGANHTRNRIWILAHSNRTGFREQRRTSPTPEKHNTFECSGNVSSQHSGVCPERQACQKQFLPLGWKPVVFWSDCDHDTEQCPCMVDYSEECQCPGPTQDEFEYGFTAGKTLFARRRIDWWETEPELDRVGNGFSGRVAQLRAIGNAQIPLVAATAWTVLENALRRGI